MPVTVDSIERSFSKLKLIKSCLRKTMSHKRLNEPDMLSIEKDLLVKLEYKDFISTFAFQKTRKIILNNYLLFYLY